MQRYLTTEMALYNTRFRYIEGSFIRCKGDSSAWMLDHSGHNTYLEHGVMTNILMFDVRCCCFFS